MTFARTMIFASFVAAVTVCGICAAHPAQYASANVKIERDGRFLIRVKFDMPAFVLNDTPARIDDAAMRSLLTESPEELQPRLDEAKQRLLHGLRIRCGDTIVRGESAEFPVAPDVLRNRGSRLPLMMEAALVGKLPALTDSIAMRFPDVLGTVVFNVERPGEEALSEPVEEGQFSAELSLRWEEEAPAEPTRKNHRIDTISRYLGLGFTHILPRGVDHILFVLGLFLLSARLRPLLWQVTAFTVAHSITLGLALYGIVRMPAMIVEPLIALSIAFVAVENLFTTELKPWRPMVVFGFGLVHGLGFASVLTETGLPRTQFATALISFNIGVELGQLSVIALAFAAVGWWARCGWYRRAIALPASCAIAIVALFWAIQRIHGGV